MNFKPGTLALIVVSPKPEYLGLPVEIQGRGYPMNFAPPYDRFNDSPIWKVKAPRKVRCTRGVLSDEFYMPEGSLLPVPPDGISDEEVEALWLPTPSIPQKEEV